MSPQYREGQDAAILGNAINPYRRVLIAGGHDLNTVLLLEIRARKWDEGFASIKFPAAGDPDK